ncbi:hypothetical protein [Acinetobacter higginsii]|uniref:hypothetical protein n=1 Tax=Acinetobacter higginsii TaxID=70347 RepID=UPI00300BB7A8
MKVGFIFGKKDKQIYDPDVYGNQHLKDIYSYTEDRQGFQNSFEQLNKIVYKKMILKLEDEYKYFYVLVGHSKEELREKIAEYWHLSDIVGYDLN